MQPRPDFELLSADYVQQRQWLQSGRLSAAELLAAQQQAIACFNPVINAFICQLSPSPAPAGLAPARLKALSGLCVAVKDNIDIKGVATTAGLAVRKNAIAATDAFAVARLRAAGASLTGKLNMHEGALGATNHNSHFGDCHNPHRAGFTPGGSSGGSGAAVAAGMVTVALGSDTMGSIRIPAAYCGVFGFKPSRGAVSNSGSVPCGRLMDTLGPLARSARDLTLVSQQLLAFDRQCPEAVRISRRSKLAQPLILLVPEDLEALQVSADIIADFAKNLAVFRDMGAIIKPIALRHYPFAAARRAGLLICESDMRLEYAAEWQQQPQGFSAYLQALLAYPDRKTAIDYSAALQQITDAAISARQWLAQGHFMLLPTTPQRAFSLSDAVPANQADLTSFANQAGLPALSLPMLSDAALPGGMQLVGPAGSDFQLLALAERWQQHSGFIYRLPASLQALC